MTICYYLDGILDAFDKAVEKHRDGWIVVKKQCLRKMAAHDDLPAGNEDHGRLSTKALASFHLIVAKVLYASKRSILDMSLGVEFLTTRVRAPDTYDWEKVSHLMEYSRCIQDQSHVPGEKNDGWLMCYVDALFVMQPNMLSYTGGELTMGKGSSMVALTKLKLNMVSLTES